jgi:8-oxo-dGTP diphosphatase
MAHTNAGGQAWVVVELVVFTIQAGQLAVLLAPASTAQGAWELPAGSLGGAESAEQAARHTLASVLTGHDVWLEQLYTFSDGGESTPIVRITYMALVQEHHVTPEADARWWVVSQPPARRESARRSVEYALQRLRAKLEYTTVGFQLLPPRFTLSELQRLYEIILDRTIDKRNFRRRVEVLGIVKPTRERRAVGAGRPAQLYRFAAGDAPPLDVTPPEMPGTMPPVSVARVVPHIRTGARRAVGRAAANGGAA